MAPLLDDYMGPVFEQIAGQAYERLHEGWRLAPAAEWSRWEGQDRNRRSIEVDIAAELEDGRILTGEIEWSSSPVDYDVHLGHVRALEALADSGQGWAAEALRSRSAGRLYVSAGGFTSWFQERVEGDPTIRLVVLEDLCEVGPST